MAKREIRLPTLCARQGNRALYSFAIDGKELGSIATVSRVHRDEGQQLRGYQRPEALAHISAIKRYLETSNAILPNALVVAFDKRVTFEPKGKAKKSSPTVLGEIVIPLEDDLADEDKPGWIVDGQQRSAALREAQVASFPVFVTAFIAETVAEQRSQFILVNSTKPLPKGLIYELLPGTPAGDLPIALLRRRYPALLLERLNLDEDSPLLRRIRTPTIIGGTIKDNSFLTMLTASIEDGALYIYVDAESGGGDTESMVRLLKNYWAAVAECFPEAWGEAPRRSRLTHGAGIISLGSLMDEIVYALGEENIPSSEDFAREIGRIAEYCHWTKGSWKLGAREKIAWDQLQNTPGDILRLSDHLLSLYRRARHSTEEGRKAA